MDTSIAVLSLLLLLQIKHLIVDWCWQPAYEWQNKGTYGHMGGIIHAVKNAVGTAACFCIFVDISMALLILAIDGIMHYHIDWAKMNINRMTGWNANTHPQFWWLTGLDQALHQITYLALVLLSIS